VALEAVHLDLANCYGIKSLRKSFDFSNGAAAYAVYAPNGSMKTSLAQTFRDLAEGKESGDRIYPDRVAKRRIVDQNGIPIPEESVLVIAPYDESFGPTENTSTLLVDSKLRKEYEELSIDVERSTQELLTALKRRSKSRKQLAELEQEISLAFTRQDDQLHRALIRVKAEMQVEKPSPLAGVRYDLLIDDSVVRFLNTQDFRVAIEDYVKKYNELLDASKYFSRETFSFYNATTIAKNLASNGFFDAKHTVNLNASERVEISSRDQLEAIIAKEKDAISANSQLRAKYAEIERQLTRNARMRQFHDYLAENQFLLPLLGNIDSLKEDIWKANFAEHKDLYDEVIQKFEKSLTRKEQIEKAALRQRTEWESVIDIFNSRFFVPFRLSMVNRERVILGTDAMPRLGFAFQDETGGESTSVERSTLMETLSTGEKKALYVLNIIFEIQARRRAGRETLLIVDDIAVSFDYRNKYAIIQYLNDIAESGSIKQIILTHNFDFFRTVNSRFVKYSNCLMVAKDSVGVSIRQAEGIRNPFVNDWKKNFFTDRDKRIASIPFLRNMIEYTSGPDHPDFDKLTALVHWKSQSESITQGDLDAILNSVFSSSGCARDRHVAVVDMIEDAADSFIDGQAGDHGVRFEKKIVLAIAIRIVAERFMVRKIGDTSFVDHIKANQSQHLLRRFSRDFANEIQAIDVMKRVVLMTPEQIHLNSFMYEPIVDMSDEHLRSLYGEVKNLNS